MAKDEDPRALIADILTATDVDRDHVPRLLELLDVGDSQVRLGAATALCVVAEEHSGEVAALAGRLADRTDEDGLAASLALEYLAVRYPNVVDAQMRQWDNSQESEYGVEKSNPMREGLDNRDLGRTSTAGENSSPGPRRVYTDDEDEEDRIREGEDEEAGNTMGQRPQAAGAEWLSLVEYESRFTELSVLASRDRRRYGDIYRTLGVIDEDEYGVALRLLRGGDSDVAQFRQSLAERLTDWKSVADVGNVLTLYDWNDEPRLWVATEYTEQRLTDRGHFAPVEAVWHAERLADGVATLHERGVVHAGIDADAVTYYGNVLQENDRQPPLLDNVGLLSTYRHYFDPSEFLDPRYAAPEYYKREFGRVDHATDIYQLGAVCYRLFTGQAPYTGEFESVRDAVVSSPPPTPTAVADVPPAVDDIVGKAMATEKLARYETVTHLRRELRSLHPEADDGR